MRSMCSTVEAVLLKLSTDRHSRTACLRQMSFLCMVTGLSLVFKYDLDIHKTLLSTISDKYVFINILT